jgi:hypothetical protein
LWRNIPREFSGAATTRTDGNHSRGRADVCFPQRRGCRQAGAQHGADGRATKGRSSERNWQKKRNLDPDDGGGVRRFGPAAAMALLRRVLNHPVSIETLIEAAVWLALPYITVGLVWAIVHPEPVQLLQAQLEKVLPAGADVAAFGEAAALWPALLLLPDACANR